MASPLDVVVPTASPSILALCLDDGKLQTWMVNLKIRKSVGRTWWDYLKAWNEFWITFLQVVHCFVTRSVDRMLLIPYMLFFEFIVAVDMKKLEEASRSRMMHILNLLAP
ncbi:hypothetical protein LINPERHAP1_LOCUS17710, partial [Linum perenne]